MSLYDLDFHAWALEQADAVKRRSANELDWDNIAEELDSLGRNEKRALVSRLEVLLLHLLKWQAQPSRRGRSWLLTLREQRRKLQRLLDDNPSFNRLLPEAVADAYGDALISAERETGLPAASAFPPACPFTLDQILDDAFTPGEAP